MRILGLSIETIELAEDRGLFRAMMDRLSIPMPASRMAATIDDALRMAAEIGDAVMVRPSFVLGGRGMDIVRDEIMLREYVAQPVVVTPKRPRRINRDLEHALECEADAIADGRDVFVPAVMEHIKQAGIHSGDSACVLSPVSIPARHLATLVEYTRRIATESRRALLAAHRITAEPIRKLYEGRPNVGDAITNAHLQLAGNAPVGRRGAESDACIRQTAIRCRVPYVTTIAAAAAAAEGILARRSGNWEVCSLPECDARLRGFAPPHDRFTQRVSVPAVRRVLPVAGRRAALHRGCGTAGGRSRPRHRCLRGANLVARAEPRPPRAR